MSTQTPFASLPYEYDYQAVMRRWQETARSVTHRYLELYVTVVGRLADAQVETTRAANLPALLPFVRIHATFQREVADAYVMTIRAFADV
jgi:hypothetical protein